MRAFEAEAPQADLPADPEDRLVASGDSYQTRPDVAYDPTSGRYLIVWTDDTDPGSVRGKFMTRGGLLSTGELILGSSQVGMPYWPMLASNLTDGGYMLLWSEPNGNIIQQPYFALAAYNLYALPLDSAGAPLATPTLITDQLTFYPVPSPGYGIAYNNTASEYLVAWQQPPGIVIGNIAHPHRVVGRKLSASGALAGDQTVFMIGSVGSIALAYSSESNEYLFTFDRYSSSWLYDLYGQRRQADTLAQLGATFNLYGMLSFGDQNNAGIAYSPETDRYLLTFEDSPSPYPQYFPDLYGRFVQAGTGTFPGYRITIITSEDPVYRGGLAYSTVDGTFLSTAWDAPGRLRARFISDGGSPVGDPFLMTQLGGVHPNLAARLDGQESERRWLATWDTLGDIYARFPAPTVVTTPLGLTPSGWTMALSLRPTLRWNTVQDAEIYRFHIHRSTDGRGIGEQLIVGGVVAENSRDPSDPSTHLVKLDRDLTTGSSLSTAGYWWFVEALGQTGDVLATSEWASFQIPPLGGSWDQVRPQLCFDRVIDGVRIGGASCLYPDGERPNPYWNDYDAMIYRWAETWDIPPALLKAIYVGETSSAIGPRRIGGQDFEPTRAYLYEPYADWNSYVRSGNPCQNRPYYYIFCLPGHPPSEDFEDLGPFPFPYDRAVLVDTSIYDYAYLGTLGGPFSDLGEWGLARIPGCLPINDPEDCPAEDHPAQYRVAASYGLGQIVYKSNYGFFDDADFAQYLREEDPPSRIPPEALYDPNLNVSFSAWLLGQKRSVYAICPQLRADSALDLWREPIKDYSGGGNEEYDDTVIVRGTYDTKPRSLVAGVTDVQYELQPYGCGSSAAMGPAGLAALAPDSQGTEIAGQWIDMWGQGVPLWVSMTAFDTGVPAIWEGQVRIYVNDSHEGLLWQSRRIRNVNPDGFITETTANGQAMAVVQWSSGVHALRAFPLIWDGSDFVLVPAFDEAGNEIDGLGSDGGGIFPFSNGSLVAFQQTYSHTAGERRVTVFAFEQRAYRPIREFVYDWEAPDASPPATSFSVEPAANEAYWIRGPADVTLRASDDRAVGSITYTLLSHTPQGPFTLPFDNVEFVLSEGIWLVQWHATDMSLNDSLDQLDLLQIDSTPPEIEALLDGEQSEFGWFTSEVTVTLNATDPPLEGGSLGSGVRILDFSLDGGDTWMEYSLPFTIDSPGQTQLLYRASDIAGNATEVFSLDILIVIDTIPPEGEIMADPAQIWPPNGKLVPVKILGQASDEGSGLARIEFQVIDEYDLWEPVIAPVDTPDELANAWERVLELVSSRRGGDRNGRLYLIVATIYDLAGNATEVETAVVVPHDLR